MCVLGVGPLWSVSAAPAGTGRAVAALPASAVSERRCRDWERQALEYIGMMRAAVATDPTHPRATAIVGELSIRTTTI